MSGGVHCKVQATRLQLVVSAACRLCIPQHLCFPFPPRSALGSRPASSAAAQTHGTMYSPKSLGAMGLSPWSVPSVL